MEINEIKKDLARKKFFDDIRKSAHHYDDNITSAIINKIKQEQKELDDKVYQIMLDNNKKEEENEIKAKIKKREDTIKLKKFLDKQIEEKKKELDFMKNLDDEQGRIWRIDNDKYKKDQIKIDNIIKNINNKNMDDIKKQIKNKENEKLKEIVTLDEYAMNKEFLEKAKMELEHSKN